MALAIQALGKAKSKITITTGAATARLTNEDCSPATGIHYLMDTIALSKVVGKAIVKDGGDSWFFLTADYALGHSLEKDTWDLNNEARQWASRYEAQMKRKPNSNHASVYSAVMHYLKAVQAAGTDDSAAVIKKMQDSPINDMFAKNGKLRPDGRMVHDMYLFQVKNRPSPKDPGITAISRAQ